MLGLERLGWFAVRDQLERLREENQALQTRLEALENRREAQWENLLSFDGSPQGHLPQDGGAA